MQLALNEDQTHLSRTAHDFIAASPPIPRLRKLRDSRDERGYTPERYARMAELGWTAIPFSEADGGLDMGMADVVLVTEALGRGLAPEPYIPSIILAGRAIARAGGAAHKASWLAPMITGDKVVALAHARRGGRHDLTRVPVRAAASTVGGGFRLTGQATQVWGGNLADGYVIAARTAGQDGDRDGITLFLLPAGVRGLRCERQVRIDSLNAAQLTLDDVAASNADVLGEVGAGHAVLSAAIDDATVALAGEMLGGTAEALERTLTYLRDRRQFGVAIGSFQALKHRAARLYIELELSRSAVASTTSSPGRSAFSSRPASTASSPRRAAIHSSSRPPGASRSAPVTGPDPGRRSVCSTRTASGTMTPRPRRSACTPTARAERAWPRCTATRTTAARSASRPKPGGDAVERPTAAARGSEA